MFAVIFEVTPKDGRLDHYLAVAAALKPSLEAQDGFLGNERLAATSNPRLYLALSFWRDEKSLIRWRTETAHHAAQTRGRGEIFADYRLRVGEVAFDSQDADLPAYRFDLTEISAAKAVTISETTELPRLQAGFMDGEVFESLTTPGRRLALCSWRDAEAATSWRPGEGRHRLVRIIRDYGLRDRREAPQFYPPVV